MAKFSFENKVAIVTGASSGIGRETVLLLAERGAHLAIASRNGGALQDRARLVEQKGCQVLVVPTDVTQQPQVVNLVDQTLKHWGQVDILIASSGQYIRSPIDQMTVPILEQSMAVNYYGPVYASLEVLPHMLGRGMGHIVFVNTMDAKTPLPPDAPYVAAKSALSGFADVLRQELHTSGVYVSTIYPGRVDTPMIENLKVPRISAKITPVQVAHAILKAIERRKAIVMLPTQTKFLYYLNVFTPNLADWAVRYFHLQGWEA